MLLHIVSNSSLFSSWERALFHCCFRWIVAIHVFYLHHSIWPSRRIIFIRLLFFSPSLCIYGYCHGKLVQIADMSVRKISHTTPSNDVRNEFGSVFACEFRMAEALPHLCEARKWNSLLANSFFTIFHKFFSLTDEKCADVAVFLLWCSCMRCAHQYDAWDNVLIVSSKS